jgi:hypothetical protein
MWFWHVNEMIELLSGMPGTQIGNESSWVRGSELVQGVELLLDLTFRRLVRHDHCPLSHRNCTLQEYKLFTMIYTLLDTMTHCHCRLPFNNSRHYYQLNILVDITNVYAAVPLFRFDWCVRCLRIPARVRLRRAEDHSSCNHLMNSDRGAEYQVTSVCRLVPTSWPSSYQTILRFVYGLGRPLAGLLAN